MPGSTTTRGARSRNPEGRLVLGDDGASDALFRTRPLAWDVGAPQPPSVALIDGDCGLCRATERWVQARDKGGAFTFHTLQSPEGQEWLGRAGMPLDTLDTMVLIEGTRPFVRSTAVLRMTRRLRAPWPMLYAFIVVPRPLRDWVYRLVARNRRHIRIGQASDGAACGLPRQQDCET